VLSAKVVLVAIFTTLILKTSVSNPLWMAAALSCLGIAFLNIRGAHTPHHHVARTIAFALQAAVAYALFDVLVMKWSPAWGMGRFLPIMLLFGALYSVLFIPMFRQPLRTIPPDAWNPLLLGAFFIALQALILITTLAVFGDATAVNVIYSSRGLWSVLAVMWFGAWFGNQEKEVGPLILRWRLLGAILLSAAIVLVFV